MSKNPEVYVFTPKTLREHDREVATAMNRATVKHVLREAVRMTGPQTMNALSKGGEQMCFGPDVIDAMLDVLDKARVRGPR